MTLKGSEPDRVAEVTGIPRARHSDTTLIPVLPEAPSTSTELACLAAAAIAREASGAPRRADVTAAVVDRNCPLDSEVSRGVAARAVQEPTVGGRRKLNAVDGRTRDTSRKAILIRAVDGEGGMEAGKVM